MGFSVDIAGDGATALEAIDARAYDVMVLDLRMSHLDGLDVLRAMQGRPSAPSTILHSAYLDVPTTVLAMRCGVADVIEKCVSPKLLADRVWELACKRQPAR